MNLKFSQQYYLLLYFESPTYEHVSLGLISIILIWEFSFKIKSIPIKPRKSVIFETIKEMIGRILSRNFLNILFSTGLTPS